jgi:uncharacterized membrane protein
MTNKIVRNLIFAFVGTVVFIGLVILGLLGRAYANENPLFGFILGFLMIFIVFFIAVSVLSGDEKENTKKSGDS